MYCKNCGTMNAGSASTCFSCGSQLGGTGNLSNKWTGGTSSTTAKPSSDDASTAQTSTPVSFEAPKTERTTQENVKVYTFLLFPFVFFFCYVMFPGLIPVLWLSLMVWVAVASQTRVIFSALLFFALMGTLTDYGENPIVNIGHQSLLCSSGERLVTDTAAYQDANGLSYSGATRLCVSKAGEVEAFNFSQVTTAQANFYFGAAIILILINLFIFRPQQKKAAESAAKAKKRAEARARYEAEKKRSG